MAKVNGVAHYPAVLTRRQLRRYDVGMRHATWPAQPGTYALLFSIGRPLRMSVGRLGVFLLLAGQYAYLGSARGPGGLRARISRHLRATKPVHWHVDSLTVLAQPVDVFALTTTSNRECQWVRRLLALGGMSVPIPRFGSSDCHEGCPAHLVCLPENMDFEVIKETLS